MTATLLLMISILPRVMASYDIFSSGHPSLISVYSQECAYRKEILL